MEDDDYYVREAQSSVSTLGDPHGVRIVRPGNGEVGGVRHEPPTERALQEMNATQAQPPPVKENRGPMPTFVQRDESWQDAAQRYLVEQGYEKVGSLIASLLLRPLSLHHFHLLTSHAS